MIADRFRDRRVFLCGDAAHIWVPFAGYGMNAGIADAHEPVVDAGGRHQRLGEPGDPRRLRNRTPADHRAGFTLRDEQPRWRGLRSDSAPYPPPLSKLGPEGDAVRARIGREAYDINVGQFCCGGLNFGYFYAGSPIIAYDGEISAARMTLYGFQPIDRAGMPHAASVAARRTIAVRRIGF